MSNRQAAGPLTDDLSHVEFETSEDVEVLSTFDNMNLREDLIRGIYSYGELINTQRIPTNGTYHCLLLFNIICSRF